MSERLNQNEQTKNGSAIRSKLLDEMDQHEKDDDFSFEFTAVTKGLGFHHQKEEKRVPHSRPRTRPDLRTNKLPPSQNSMPEVDESLRAFYGKSRDVEALNSELSSQLTLTEQQDTSPDASVDNSSTYILASKASQLFAWLVDVFIVLGALALTGMSLAGAAGIPLASLQATLTSVELITFVAIFFSVFYLTYFSILDLATTPGKALFNIRLACAKQSATSRVTFWQTLTRSLVTLFSVLLAGMPTVFDFQGKLSDTTVVKRNV